MNDPRGSIWRKWDLHIHSPSSVLNNQYPGTNEDEKWNGFIETVKSLKDVSVLGITDYFSIDGYKKLLEYRDKNPQDFKNIELLLPNVELRILPVTDEQTPINLHVIFSPDKEMIDNLESQFFSNLTFSYGGSTYRCIRQDLINLGKAHSHNNGMDEHSAYKVGVEQFKTNLDQLKQAFKDNEKLRRNSLIIVSNSGADGASGIQHSSLAATRQEIYRFADAIFSANPSDRSYFLGKDSDSSEQIIKKYGSLKPCIHGSDAHELEKICKPDLDRFTWIKADTTFEGLKQIVCEPEERVYIGRSVPKSKNDANVIDRIEIKNSNHWFDEEPIPLNENLVTIIGEKGAGKTALADFIALTGGDFNTKEDYSSSFVSKALKSTKQIGETIENCIVTIYWRDGSQDQIKITEDFEDYEETKKVRYLSQSFIERKCHPEQAEELQKEIEGIIFQPIPIQDRMGQTAFVELKKIKTQSIEVKKTNCGKQIAALNDEIFALEEEINSLDSKKEEKVKLEIEAKQLKEQKPKPQTKEEESIEAKLTLLNNRKNVLNEQIAVLKVKLTTIETIKVTLASLKEYIQGETSDIKRNLESVDLATLCEKLKFTVESDFEITLESKKKEIEAQIKKLQGIQEQDKSTTGAEQKNKQVELNDLTETYVSALDLNNVIDLISSLESKSSIAENARRTIKSFDEKIAKYQKRIEELDKSIKEINNIKKPLLPTKKTERDNAYKNYFVFLQEEKQILEEIYSPLKEKMNKENMGEKNQIDFFARIELNVKEFFDNADSIIDFSRIGTYCRNSDILYKEIKSLAEKIEIGEQSDVLSLITHLYQTFEENDGKPIEINSQLLRRKNHLDFYKWIFDVSDFKVNYSIKYQGTNIELLSPGKKGIVLLLMYLALDTESSIPLIIDQPEENLDNKSLYPYLVDYFKIAKRRRQIIIITHNPNLVLNTDAEQIIVANFEAVPTIYKSRITYISGGIENSYINNQLKTPLRQQGIREHGADILEGGKIAFIKRKDRYEY
jgi:predicted ATPase